MSAAGPAAADPFPFGSPDSAFDEAAGYDSDEPQQQEGDEPSQQRPQEGGRISEGSNEDERDSDEADDEDEEELDESAIEWADPTDWAAAGSATAASGAVPTAHSSLASPSAPSSSEMRFRVLQVSPFDRPAAASANGLSSSVPSGSRSLQPHPSLSASTPLPHAFALPVIPTTAGMAPPKKRRKAFDSDTEDSSGGSSSSDSDSDSSRARRRRKKREAILDEASLKPLPRSTELAMRTIMCCIALILLWATSLTLANFLAEKWLGNPSFAPVVDQWMSSFSLASREADLYSQCGTNVIRGCGLALNNSIIARDKAWRDSEARAANETLRVEAQAAFCESTSSTLLRSIDSWMQLGAALVYNTACSPTEIDSLRTLLNDRRENKEALSSLTAVYISTTGQILDDTALQVTAVEQYNSAFITNASLARSQGLAKLNSQLGSLSDSSVLGSAVDAKLAVIKAATKRMTDCATVKGGANSYCPGGTLVDGYSSLLSSLLSSYVSLQSLGQSNVRAMTLYSASVVHKLSQVQSFFNLLYPVADALDSLGINVLSIPTLSDLPNMAPNSAFVAALASSVDMPLMDAYYNQRFGAIQTSWNSDFEAQRAAIRMQVTGAVENVTGVIHSSFPSDPAASYDPPQVQPKVQLLQDQMGRTGAQFQQEQDARVNLLVAQSGVAQTAAESQFNATLAAANNVTSLDLVLPPLSTTQLQMPIAAFHGDFSFSRVVLGMLAAVGGVFLVGDIAYRNLASLRVIYQYVRSPQEMLPVIDARTQESKSQDAAAASRSASCADRAAFYLNHSIVLWMFLFGFLVWVVIIVAAVYIPMYTSYKDACVRRTSNGTFLTENSNTLLYNYASISGNKEILFALTAYESRRAMACGRYEQRYATQAATQAVTQSDARAAQKRAWGNMDLVARCLDPTASFNLTALQAALNATRSLPALLDPMAPITPDLRSSCSVDFSLASSSSTSSSSSSPSGQSSFNCTWLPTCVTSVVCPGPNAGVIRASSWDSSCTTEYTLHQSVFFWVLVIVIFLCLNASRIAFNKALVRLGWRALTPAGLTFMATCDHRGQQVTKNEQIERQRQRRKKRGSDSSSGSRSASASSLDRRRKQQHDFAADPSEGSTPVPRSLLRRYMTAYERSANRYLFLTLLAHVPYLLLLLALSDPFGWGSDLHTAPPKPYNSPR